MGESLGLTEAQYFVSCSLVPIVHNMNYNMNFENVKLVGLEANYHKRLFLEAWYSTLDRNAVNDHIVLPEAYN